MEMLTKDAETLASVVSVAGPLFSSLFSADSTIDQGFAERGAKYFEATQMDQKAREIQAKGSHEIEDNARKYEILISKAIAINGAGGGGGGDAQFLNMVAGIAEEGARTSQRINFGAQTESNFYKKSANVSRFEGEKRVSASGRKAMSTLLSGAGTAASNLFYDGKIFSTNRLAGIK